MSIPFRKSLKDFRGFTLVELLVVIGIISVLATVLLLQLGTARSKARDAKRVADINQMRSAVEQYFDDNGSYPSTNVFGTLAGFTKYISPIPADPLGASACTTYSGSGSSCYGYAWGALVGTSYTKYHLWAELEVYNRAALASDSDVNSAGGNWTAAGGASVNGDDTSAGTSGCTSASNTDCVFDLGIR